MGSTDKRVSSKESLMKPKSHRIRFGNVKDFHGRRQHNTENGEKTPKKGSTKGETSKAANPPSPPGSLKSFAQNNLSSLSRKLSELSFMTKPVKILKRSEPLSESFKPTFDFNEYMNQWEKDFCKPLTTSSTNVEFDMPYCYSEEFYSQVSAKFYLAQPFGRIGEPPEMWNSHVDVWYEKAQMALQYFRQLCVQPSRLPEQTIIIKRSVALAQFVAGQCALLGTELYFDSDSFRIGTNFVFEEKDKSSIFLVPDDEGVIKQQDCTQIQLKSDPIYSSSWQS